MEKVTQDTLAGIRWMVDEFTREVGSGDFSRALLSLELLERRVRRAQEATTF